MAWLPAAGVVGAVVAWGAQKYIDHNSEIELPPKDDDAMQDFWKLYEEMHREPRQTGFPPGVYAGHPSSFTRIPDENVQYVVGNLIAQWIWNRTEAGTSTQATFINARDIVQSRFGNRQPELMTARIDFQGRDSDGIHDRYAIQMGRDHHFATIHLNRTYTFQSPTIIRRAFWLSILLQQHLWVDNDTSVPTAIAKNKGGYDKLYKEYFDKNNTRNH